MKKGKKKDKESNDFGKQFDFNIPLPSTKGEEKKGLLNNVYKSPKRGGETEKISLNVEKGQNEFETIINIINKLKEKEVRWMDTKITTLAIPAKLLVEINKISSFYGVTGSHFVTGCLISLIKKNMKEFVKLKSKREEGQEDYINNITKV